MKKKWNRSKELSTKQFQEIRQTKRRSNQNQTSKNWYIYKYIYLYEQLLQEILNTSELFLHFKLTHIFKSINSKTQAKKIEIQSYSTKLKDHEMTNELLPIELNIYVQQ